MKIQRGMKFWAFVFTMQFGTNIRADMSALRAGRIYPQGSSSLLEAEWIPGLLNADRRNSSLENFQGLYTALNQVPPALWHSSWTNCGTAHPRNSKGNFNLMLEFNIICILINNRIKKCTSYLFLRKIIVITFMYLELRKMQTQVSLKYI